MLIQMTWFYLALLAPLLFAIVNLFDDNLLQHVYRSAHIGTIVSGCFGIIPAMLILAFNYDNLRLPTFIILLSMLAGFLTVVGYYCYFKALEKENPSIIAALFCVTPALIPFVAYFLVHERLSVQAAIGFGTVTLAAFLYSMTDIKKFTVSRALFPVMVAALIFDGVALANKYIYTQADFYPAYFYFSIGMLFAGIVFLSASELTSKDLSIKHLYKKNSVKLLMLLAFVEVVAGLAEFTQSKALSQGPVSLVKALGNMHPLYILAISLILYPVFPKFFREAEQGVTKVKVVLLLAMIAGAYLAVS